MAEGEVETVDKKLDRYIWHAKDLNKRCQKHQNIKGISKLMRKISAEINFLEGLGTKNGKNKENSLSSSNLINIESIVDALETFPNVSHVLQPFQSPGHEHPLVVDVICNHGYTWVKVIARKAQALHLIWAGKGQYGEKSIHTQAEQFQQCARLNPVNFTNPQIVFSFCQGVTAEMRQHFLQMGIHVKGDIEEVDEITKQKLTVIQSFSDTESEDESLDCDASTLVCDTPEPSHVLKQQTENCPIRTSSPTSVNFVPCPDIQKVNLDVSTMIVLVSNVCHGHCNYNFQEDILNQQAASEREGPVLPSIHEFLKGKQLYACSTALSSFQKIADIVGGENERRRARELLSTVTPVPDEISDRTTSLNTSAQLKERAKVVFGTGDAIKAVTTTSNMGFVRAAQNQGVDFAVFLHESRALTEQKQATATPL